MKKKQIAMDQNIVPEQKLKGASYQLFWDLKVFDSEYFFLPTNNSLIWRDNPFDRSKLCCSNHSSRYCSLFFWFWRGHFSFPNMFFHQFEFFRVFLEKLSNEQLYIGLNSSNLIGSLKTCLENFPERPRKN